MTQTHDEQTVERVAKAIFAVDFPTGSNWGRWNEVSGDMRSSYMSCARAALSALPPQEVSVQEAALRKIVEGYGPNHMSKYARDTALSALSEGKE